MVDYKKLCVGEEVEVPGQTDKTKPIFTLSKRIWQRIVTTSAVPRHNYTAYKLTIVTNILKTYV